MFNKAKYGVPQFYPRDLKKRVDEYVVGQDRAKKTICSVIFNHYQSLRRRTQEEDQDRRLQEKLQRQKFTRDKDIHDSHGEPHPAEGWSYNCPNCCQYTDGIPEDEWPGHRESVQQSLTDMSKALDQSFISEDNHMPHHVKIDKSNLLLIGPTGVGKTYILE